MTELCIYQSNVFVMWVSGCCFLISCCICPVSVSQDSNGPPRSDAPAPPALSALRPSRVVSSTSEEEEALTEKFLKINCKYITDGKVSQCSAFLIGNVSKVNLWRSPQVIH